MSLLCDNEIILMFFWRHMVNAVVPLGEKPNTYGWLQLEKKAAQELQKLIQASNGRQHPHVHDQPNEPF